MENDYHWKLLLIETDISIFWYLSRRKFQFQVPDHSDSSIIFIFNDWGTSDLSWSLECQNDIVFSRLILDKTKSSYYSMFPQIISIKLQKWIKSSNIIQLIINSHSTKPNISRTIAQIVFIDGIEVQTIFYVVCPCTNIENWFLIKTKQNTQQWNDLSKTSTCLLEF